MRMAEEGKKIDSEVMSKEEYIVVRDQLLAKEIVINARRKKRLQKYME